MNRNSHLRTVFPRRPAGTRPLATFDEVRTGPQRRVDWHRLECANAVRIDLPEGVHEIETFEPYTIRYLQLHAPAAAITIEKAYLRERAGWDVRNLLLG